MPDSMADNPGEKVAIPALATIAYTAKQPKKRKTDSKRESKRESDNKQNKTRVKHVIRIDS